MKMYDTFVADAKKQWEKLVETLPADHQARMPRGHYEISFHILDFDPTPTLQKFRERLKKADEERLTGWGPFCYKDDTPFEPYNANGQIETWLGNPDRPFPDRTSETCDFWRADPAGFMFLQRGYQEDCEQNIEPGTRVFPDQPICIVAEAMLYVARFSRLHRNNNRAIITRCFYSGLQGRELKNIRHPRVTHGSWVCRVGETNLKRQATVEEIEDNLAEVVYPLLQPLYELFSFYELKMHMVVKIIEDLKRGRC